jgi:hypothetical protein
MIYLINRENACQRVFTDIEKHWIEAAAELGNYCARWSREGDYILL